MNDTDQVDRVATLFRATLIAIQLWVDETRRSGSPDDIRRAEDISIMLDALRDAKENGDLESAVPLALFLGVQTSGSVLHSAYGQAAEDIVNQFKRIHEGRKKGVEIARAKITKWTPDVDLKAREILAGLRSDDTEDGKLVQVVAELWSRHGIEVSKSTARNYLFKT